MVFMAPIKQDMDNLLSILHCFGNVIGLETNLQKSSYVSIRCSNRNLGEILHNLPATRAHFPIRYLRLPLSIWQLKRADF